MICCCAMALRPAVADSSLWLLYRLEALLGNCPERYRFKLEVLPRVAAH